MGFFLNAHTQKKREIMNYLFTKTGKQNNLKFKINRGQRYKSIFKQQCEIIFKFYTSQVK